MEFAKPVIGTREPAPAILPILLKTLSRILLLTVVGFIQA